MHVLDLSDKSISGPALNDLVMGLKSLRWDDILKKLSMVVLENNG